MRVILAFFFFKQLANFFMKHEGIKANSNLSLIGQKILEEKKNELQKNE